MMAPSIIPTSSKKKNKKKKNSSTSNILYYELNGTRIRIYDNNMVHMVELFDSYTCSWKQMNHKKDELQQQQQEEEEEEENTELDTLENQHYLIMKEEAEEEIKIFETNSNRNQSKSKSEESEEEEDVNLQNRIIHDGSTTIHNTTTRRHYSTTASSSLSSFDMLYTELILHIFSFCDYYSIPIFPDFNLDICEFFGKFPDGSTQAMYMNIKFPWVFGGKNISGDALICMFNAKCLKFDALPLLHKLHLMAPRVDSLHLGYVTTYNLNFVNDYDRFHYFDKISRITLGGDAVSCLVPKLVNIRDVWIEDIQISLNDLNDLIMNCKSHSLHFRNLNITDSNQFPIATLKRNSFIKHLELYFENDKQYRMKLNDLSDITTLDTLYCNLSTREEVIALCKSTSIKHIALYSNVISEELFREIGIITRSLNHDLMMMVNTEGIGQKQQQQQLQRKNNIQSIRFYIRPDDIFKLEYLHLTGVKSIEVFSLHYLDEREQRYTLNHVLQFHEVMSRSNARFGDGSGAGHGCGFSGGFSGGSGGFSGFSGGSGGGGEYEYYDKIRVKNAMYSKVLHGTKS